MALSGGDQQLAFCGDEALVAVGAVAVADVVGHGLGQGVPAVVVGVVDDELADAPEVALDAVQRLAQRGVDTSSGVAPAAHSMIAGVLCVERLSAIRYRRSRRA